MATADRSVVGVGMVDDHPSPVWGIERILDRQPDLELVCSASTVGGLLAQGIAMDIVILDLREPADVRVRCAARTGDRPRRGAVSPWRVSISARQVIAPALVLFCAFACSH